MNKSVKYSGMSLRGLIAGGLVAGAIGLSFGGGGYGPDKGKGAPSGSPTSYPSDEDKGVGGSAGPAQPTQTGQIGASALPPNIAPGWKIRICSEKTKAQTINFKISHPDQKTDKSAKEKNKEKDQASMTTPTQGQEMATWSQGDPSLVAIPETFSKVEKIKIEAIPTQKDMKSELCVLFNDHVTKRMSFNDREETTVKMDESSTCGC